MKRADMVIPGFNVWSWEEQWFDEEEVFGDLIFPGVYFVQAGDDHSGPVKIGIALDVGKRFGALKIGHYDELYIRLILQTEMSWTADLLSVERRLHETFKEHRIRGEWFECGGMVARFMENPGGCLPILHGLDCLAMGIRRLTPELVETCGYANETGLGGWNATQEPPDFEARRYGKKTRLNA